MSRRAGANCATVGAAIWNRSGTHMSSSPCSMLSIASSPGTFNGGAHPRATLRLTRQPTSRAAAKSFSQASSAPPGKADRGCGNFAMCSLTSCVSTSGTGAFSRTMTQRHGPTLLPEAVLRTEFGELVDASEVAAGTVLLRTTLSPGVAPRGTGNNNFSSPALTDNFWLPGRTPAGMRKVICCSRCSTTAPLGDVAHTAAMQERQERTDTSSVRRSPNRRLRCLG
mmetsp:Transcript_16685/g.47718  ORF Transcript_16685/g.47718 Transcript_16685/m.47718 type:complete len:225 (+) Transcript_16685:1371-2045(+)